MMVCVQWSAVYDCGISQFLNQIINPTRPAPAVESLAKGTMGSAPPTRNCYMRYFKR